MVSGIRKLFLDYEQSKRRIDFTVIFFFFFCDSIIASIYLNLTEDA